MKRVISDTKLLFTRRGDGKTLAMGEGEVFEIYDIKGLGIGEVEKETAGNALQDGELWLGSRVLNRVIEVTTAWGDAQLRSQFVDFFQHNVRFDVELLFNGATYYGSCVLDEAYDMEQHKGHLHETSGIDLQLYFDDPHLYTDNVYRYQIGSAAENHTLFYNTPEEQAIAFPPCDGFCHIFSLLMEAQEYRIVNPSSTPNGVEVCIQANGNVENPRIENLTTGQFLQVGRPKVPLKMTAGDVLYINTQMGNIQVLLNNVDVMRHVSFESRMVQVIGGPNVLLFGAASGADRASCEVSFRGKVLGV